MNALQTTLDRLKTLGTPQELRAGAPAGRAWCNSHIHLPPNFSAFESVKQAVELAAAQDVRVVGVTNYYDYEVYGDFAQLARRHGIFPLFGLEIIALIDELVKGGVKINDPGNPGRIYVCGKGATRFAPMEARAQALLDIIRRNDADRMRQMIRKLEAIFAQRGLPTGLDEAAIVGRVMRRHGCPPDRVYLQERHLCQAFQEVAYQLLPPEARRETMARVLGLAERDLCPTEPVKLQNEIRSRLIKSGKPAFVEEKFLSFEEAYQMILAMGAIPCYPTLADGTTPICPFEEPVDKLIANIRQRGMHFVEFIPIRNSPQVLRHYVKAMRAAGLAVTAGTEHNTLDLLPLEPTCAGGAPIDDDLKAIFWEGACIVAAHQFLTLNGQCGFVDSAGRPNPAHRTDEERLAAFSALGARVIRRYDRGV